MSRPELIIPYDPKFLGDDFVVPVPTLSHALQAVAFADGAVLDYTHYSLIMHAMRRVAIVTAHNVDASRSVRVKGGLTWQLDERAGEHQLGPETYHANQLDKGHLVRREDVLWGSVSEAKLANKATYFYTNAAPQHQNFNQDEWVTLQDWVLDKATDFSYRLCVFTGPVLRDNDPVLTDLPPELRTAIPATGPAQIPAAFWKVIVLRDTEAGGEDLSVVAFAMRQSEMWNDKEGRRLLNLKVHQVTLEAIEGWTGLDFGDLKRADELGWSESRVRAVTAGEAPDWPQVRGPSDIVYSGPTRRLRGLRVSRGASSGRTAPRSHASMRQAGDIHAASDCGCGDVSFDAREAVAALSRDVARLTEIVAAHGRAREEPAPVPADTTRSARPRSIPAAPQAAAGV
jgi:endonuclease G